VKTGDLIRALAADGMVPPPPRRVLALALIPGVAIAVCLYFAVLGLRPHFLELLGEPRFLFKICFTILLVGLAAAVAPRLLRPGSGGRGLLGLIVIPPALLAVAVLAELIAVPAAQWGHRLIGSNAMVCLKSIPFLGLAPLVATLIAFRNGAPDNPTLAGAGAGLFAGAIGAALYATHCPDDSPLFVAVWYPLGISFVTALGAVAGSRLLRW
jgi:hypothetical protein